ncbi:hypothetical protein BIV57_09645 [Mangrovactinospora gilvigrisea]|uniref:Serine protease n=1 Tax=Mangrovactinospora gilvigrisea TaxID=1428644 RepID=A0A1J7C8F7_9ACTN|nr:trypsin-like peptidase domain-containing protein [Mangrovactinospora gilvigrisea]OIV37816.1 hypothetical protein BIV57_09645 [Mangrovactinospora gilvigrisea]
MSSDYPSSTTTPYAESIQGTVLASETETPLGASIPPPPIDPPVAHGAEGRKRPRRRPSKVVALAAAAVIAALAGGGATGYLTATHFAGSSSSTYTTGSTLSSSKQGNVAAISAKTMPSTVEISVTTQSGSDTGSGIILSSTGEILTNYHVIADAAQGNGTVKVSFSNGKTASATVTGSSASNDLALIKASGVSGLTPASLGDSSKVQIGDQVVAIGSPEGLSGTVTSGIVSALNRKVSVDVGGSSSGSGSGGFDGQLPRNWWNQQYGGGSGGSGNGSSSGTTATYQAIQTDASLNPGNSGGPLINSAGQVIGVNAAMYSDSSSDGSSSTDSGSVGLGFSIPINHVKDVIKQMEQNGSS